jgi:hypothetical protein
MAVRAQPRVRVRVRVCATPREAAHCHCFQRCIAEWHRYVTAHEHTCTICAGLYLCPCMRVTSVLYCACVMYGRSVVLLQIEHQLVRTYDHLIQARAASHRHARVLSHTHARAHSATRMRARTEPHACARALSHTHARARTEPYACARARTRTHLRCC